MIKRFPFLIIIVLLISYSCKNAAKNEKLVEPKTSKKTEKPLATIADVEKGIHNYITQKTKGEGGYFTIADDTLNLKLRLVRVHTEYLSVLKKGSYFACVDLADVSGDVYDVDFFLEGTTNQMEVTKTTLHKLNGKPFYTWKQNKKDKTWFTVPTNRADNTLLGVIEGEDQFEFFYTISLPKITSPARLWLPIPQSDDFQTITIKSIVSPIELQTITESKFGNKIGFAELNSTHSEKTIELAYDVIRKEKGPYEAPQPSINALNSSPLLPTGGRFQEIADSVLFGKENDNNLVKARALYDYVIETVRYAKQGKYGTGDANFACDSKSGNCTEFHSLFISLAKSAGIPARFAIGAAIPANRDEGGTDGYHCWAEFFAEGKWWPIDISEANKYSALATYYFGHHPANRIELSRGRDLVVQPSPSSGTIPFFAYPILEMNGIESKVKTRFSFKR